MAFSGGMARAVAPEPTQERVDSVSTAAATVFGAYVGETLYRMQAAGLPIDIDSFTSALGKVLKKEPTGFTPDQADRYMSSVMEELRASVADTVSLASQQEYLRQQASRKGVVTTPSGLLFEVVTEGEGNMPQSGDKVTITYAGRLADGTMFDRSEQPVEFDVDRLVPGFTEGLKMMKPGGVYRIYIPASLGYGAEGIPGAIPGNAALVFDIKLLGVGKTK